MFDINEFRITGKNINSREPQKKSEPKKKKIGNFIKGPIPLYWIRKALKLAPCAIRIGMVLWYISGLRKSETFILSNVMLKGFNLDRHTKYRGLKLLEDAGLIEIERRFKKNPRVTIKMKWY
jgi:hypothetical protein